MVEMMELSDMVIETMMGIMLHMFKDKNQHNEKRNRRFLKAYMEIAMINGSI